MAVFQHDGRQVPGPQADRARELARAALEELLGPEPGTAPATEVVVGHVHVSDVTVGDPRLVDPGEE